MWAVQYRIPSLFAVVPLDGACGPIKLRVQRRQARAAAAFELNKELVRVVDIAATDGAADDQWSATKPSLPRRYWPVLPIQRRSACEFDWRRHLESSVQPRRSSTIHFRSKMLPFRIASDISVFPVSPGRNL